MTLGSVEGQPFRAKVMSADSFERVTLVCRLRAITSGLWVSQQNDVAGLHTNID